MDALAWALGGTQALHGVLLALLTAYVLARVACRLLHARRRISFDVLRLVWHYSAAQGVIGLILTLAPAASS
jgi:hypothetical protein